MARKLTETDRKSLLEVGGEDLRTNIGEECSVSMKLSICINS